MAVFKTPAKSKKCLFSNSSSQTNYCVPWKYILDKRESGGMEIYRFLTIDGRITSAEQLIISFV